MAVAWTWVLFLSRRSINIVIEVVKGAQKYYLHAGEVAQCSFDLALPTIMHTLVDSIYILILLCVRCCVRWR